MRIAEMIQSLQDFLRYVAGATNYEQQRNFRHDRQNFDLERLAQLAAELGDPHHSLPTVHVAGSKGKGSIVRALEALLEHQGSRTGAFLSPHLTSVLERVRIDGQTVGEELFLTEANRLVQVCAATGHQPTFFEILHSLTPGAGKGSLDDLTCVSIVHF